MTKPRIGLVLGDPCGIGPEIAAKLLARPEVAARAQVLVLGDRAVFAAGQQTAGLSLDVPEVPEAGVPEAGVSEAGVPEAGAHDAGGIALRHVPFAASNACPPGAVCAQAGAHALELLRTAADLATRGALDAVVFAPLSKQAMMEGGLQQQDELSFLADHLAVRRHVCELATVDGLWSSRVTSHVPLSQVAQSITAKGIRDAVTILHETLQATGIAAPRIAVSALNPHAGEGGRFGREEIEVIGPAVGAAQARGIDALGPLPADTVFVRARWDGFHGVVSMFHDQCQIAMKLLGFDRGVTVLAGLPFPVTTPAHGTAFDIVGQGSANPEPISHAFDVALDLIGDRD